MAHRELLWSWSVRDLRARYKQSALGAAWAVVQPLTMMLLMTVVFTRFLPVSSDGIPYPAFAYVGLVPWFYFATVLTFGTPVLVNNYNLVSKIYFPREILPFSVLISGLVDFLIAGALVAVFLVFYRIPLTAAILWLPILVLAQMVFMGGLVLITSILTVYFRDIRFVVPLALQLLMYATPIIYPLSSVPAKLLPIYLLNPMAGLVDGYRRTVLMGQAPGGLALGMALGVSLLTAALGVVLFRRLEGDIADVI